MADNPQIRVGDELYEIGEYRLGDPVLIEQVTGMKWAEYAARVDDMVKTQAEDPIAVLGLVAVAMWQAHPDWNVREAAKRATMLAISDLEFVAPDGGDRPPVPAEGRSLSPTSPEKSTTGAED